MDRQVGGLHSLCHVEIIHFVNSGVLVTKISKMNRHA